jgi:hypothetical protein
MATLDAAGFARARGLARARVAVASDGVRVDKAHA